MSCQPYLQWWISPRAQSLLKTDHLVSSLLFLLPPPCSLNSSAAFSCILYHGEFFICPPFAWLWFFPHIVCLLFTMLGAFQLPSKLNASRLWPLQGNTSVLCLSRAVCFAVVGPLSSHLSAHVCSETFSDCLLSIQYPSQVKGSKRAPISSKPSPK